MAPHDPSIDSAAAYYMLDRICDGFEYASDIKTETHPIPAETLPEEFRTLLVHNEHMTTTLNSFYHSPVELRVLRQRTDGDHYCREILLTLEGTDRVVEYGVMNFDLQYASDDVREAVLDKKTPLGDVLIRYNVLRRIEPQWFLKVDADSNIMEHFGKSKPKAAFGRLGTIYYEGKPAIELLEVVADR